MCLSVSGTAWWIELNRLFFFVVFCECAHFPLYCKVKKKVGEEEKTADLLHAL